MRTRALCAVLVSVGLVAAACSNDSPARSVTTADTAVDTSTAAEVTTTSAAPETTVAAPVAATFTTIPGVEQLGILDAAPGDAVTIRGADGAEAATGVVDEQGAFLARKLTPYAR